MHDGAEFFFIHAHSHGVPAAPDGFSVPVAEERDVKEEENEDHNARGGERPHGHLRAGHLEQQGVGRELRRAADQRAGASEHDGAGQRKHDVLLFDFGRGAAHAVHDGNESRKDGGVREKHGENAGHNAARHEKELFISLGEVYDQAADDLRGSRLEHGKSHDHGACHQDDDAV